MNPPSVALLHYTSPPVVGGVEEILRQQAMLLHRHRWFARVFSGKGEPFEGIPFEKIPLLHALHPDILHAHEKLQQGETESFEKLSHYLYELLKARLQEHPILIAHNVLVMPFNLPLTYALARLAQDGYLKIVSWSHDSPYFYPQYNPLWDQPPWNILKTPLPGVDYVVISESRKKEFARLFGSSDRFKVIPNGVDPIRFFRLDPSTVWLIQELQLFEREWVFIQPSRLHPRKNMELSIHIVHALWKRGRNAVLLITGAYDPHHPVSSPYLEKLRRMIQDLGIQKNVFILADYTFHHGEKLHVTRITTRDLYLIADALLFPSHMEGFGIPILEAGMIKLPVFCSSIPPHWEVGGDDVFYFSLDEKPENIAKKIIQTLENLPTSRLFRRTIKNYTWDNIFHHTLEPFLLSLMKTG